MFIHRSALDWERLESESVVVDVGGSTGNVALILLKEHPHLRYVVQDLDKVIMHDAVRVCTAPTRRYRTPLNIPLSSGR